MKFNGVEQNFSGLVSPDSPGSLNPLEPPAWLVFLARCCAVVLAVLHRLVVRCAVLGKPLLNRWGGRR